ncbi:hypothetical protein RAS2_07420 [Phycisphaerae bacterium RAS2]|nr:hypothetical protein RAS2_07420 [Phycisphaerae bacterium RAS2]
MPTNMIESRVHRILRRMERYRPARPEDADRLGLTTLLEQGERLIGMYLNPPGPITDEVAVTTERIFLHRPGLEPQHFKYCDIQDLSMGEEEKASRSVTVTLKDGSVIVVDFAGGEGKLRDSLSFLHFLSRAKDDIQLGNTITERSDAK